MAESKNSQSSGKGSSGGSGSGGSNNQKRKPLRELVEEARDQVGELLGRPIESVLGIERGEDGWQVTLEVLELSRVPSTTDVLGKYLVELDDDGEVVGMNRLRRYNRAEAGED
ncbi:gas vesicle protein [Thermoleophilia bacterium SCSIO 60948]|nr:gas vesicle protein [Thermoleophilia bacterium SCSIO 60948]